MSLSDYESVLASPVSAASSLGSSAPVSGGRSTRSSWTSSLGPSLPDTGPTRGGGETSARSTPPISLPPTSSAAASHARTSQSPGSTLHEMACMVLALASGLTWRESLKLRDQSGSWSKTWREAGRSGFPMCSATWESSVTKRFRSQWRLATSALPTCVPESSCWPTPTASSYGSTNNGCPGDGREVYATGGKLSLWSMASREGGGRKLNPDFLCWLMGFPAEWVKPTTGPTGTPSSPPAQKS